MNITTLQGATVLITGGTGTFGNAFLDECLAAGADEIRIFSRDTGRTAMSGSSWGTSGTRDLSTPPCMGSISFFTLLL